MITSDKKSELFRQAAQDLIAQIRDIFKATISLSVNRNDPIRLAELHVQLANNYRGSPALRIAWLDTLAQNHIAERWYRYVFCSQVCRTTMPSIFSEAAVCQAHSVAIIAKQLSLRDGLKVDFALLNSINRQIYIDEHLNGSELPATQGSKFTQVCITKCARPQRPFPGSLTAQNRRDDETFDPSREI